MQRKNFLSQTISGGAGTKMTIKRELRLFGNVRVMVCAALFIALSIVLGKYLSFTIGAFRISLENLTVLMAGIFFGPVCGVTVGLAADIIGSILVGYSINPIIALGAASIGLVSGLVFHYSGVKNLTLRTLLSVGFAHVIGSMVIKSIGLYVYYSYAIPLLALRIPLYLAIGFVEFYIIVLLRKNRAFSHELERMMK
jgi:Protein of unknown function (DUF1393).